jgi:hypothetical protein
MSVWRTRLTGLALLAFAVAWTVGAFWLIQDGFGGGPISPRGFPVGLGILLGLLSVALIAGSFGKADPRAEDDMVLSTARGSEAWAIATTFVFLFAYMAGLYLVGFVIATIMVLAATLFFALRYRSPLVLFGVPLVLSFGIWLLMGKLMGVYLPHGILIHGI